jgi:MFS family permease
LAKASLFKDLSQVFKEGRNLKRWLIISSVTTLPLGMVLPFSQVFAHEFKGADQYILGYMVTGFALTPLLFGIPFGRLADKIGRKKVIYLIAPLFWASNLTLIWAPGPGLLIAAGILQGFFFVSLTVTGAMTFELVPAEQMGRWLGMIRFVRLLLTAGSAYAAGVIWDNLGPQYVFLTFIGFDLFIRMPLLIGMPETLALRTEKE